MPLRTDEPDSADELLDAARNEARHGSLERAWRLSLEAAERGREFGDGRVLAQAALVITGPDSVHRAHAASRQALCLEALAMLGDSDLDLRSMVEAQLAAVTSAWAATSTFAGQWIGHDEARRRYLALQAGHARALGPKGVGHRLAIGGELVDLGVASGDPEIRAWGRLWQLDAMGQLGLRSEWNPAFIDLTAAVERMGSPSWMWRLAMVQATLALQEDRLGDVPGLVSAAAEAGTRAGVPDAPMLDLIVRSVLAQRTGEGLAEVEAEVARALEGLPFLAQGWRAQLLADLGRTDEAVAIWRSLEPHIDHMPPAATEWLVAQAGHATLAILAGDREMAARLRVSLEPLGTHHVAPLALSPYGGPVALCLGRLCAFLDDDESAARWLHEARSRAEAVVAPWFTTVAREELERLGRAFGPLSPREDQVARMVARGLTNRTIAAELVLSERTVEQHVRSILRKLDLSTRSGVAAWLAGQG